MKGLNPVELSRLMVPWAVSQDWSNFLGSYFAGQFGVPPCPQHI